MIALAFAITMGVEVVRQKDDIGRMNTVFKFYMQAWVLFGIGTAFGLASWLPRAARWSRSTRRLAGGMALILFACAALYPPLAARAKVLDRFSAQDQPHTLDGMAYMQNAVYYDNNQDVLIPDDKAGHRMDVAQRVEVRRSSSKATRPAIAGATALRSIRACPP